MKKQQSANQNSLLSVFSFLQSSSSLPPFSFFCLSIILQSRSFEFLHPCSFPVLQRKNATEKDLFRNPPLILLIGILWNKVLYFVFIHIRLATTSILCKCIRLLEVVLFPNEIIKLLSFVKYKGRAVSTCLLSLLQFLPIRCRNFSAGSALQDHAFPQNDGLYRPSLLTNI